MSVITNLEPKLLWKHFDEIRKIPRCSKHEEKIRAYIVAFAKEQGLPLKEDKVGNIVIRKPATKGMENKPIIVLQGHMDMVCEKNSDVQHDFTKDPINLKREGDLLTADGTSLGADNGIGVAISLAILEESTIKHGSLEGLFTIDEETGLTGAFALGKDMLKGRIMLNLDSEDFGVITVGCAGGGDSQIELPLKQTSPEKALKGLQITIAGLRGGHSGVDAHEQRGNAIKILTRLLWKATNDSEIHLSSIKGGDKHNAIPREATAIIATPATKTNKVIDLIKGEGKDIAEEIKPIDPKLKIDIKHCDLPKKIMTKDDQGKALNLLHALPHGVDKMSYDIPNLVETSTNLATVVTEENKLVVGLSSRSSIMSALQDFRDRIHAIGSLAGATVTEDTPYPGWKPNLESKLLARSKTIFKDMFGEEPKVEAIHAGLECGIIGEKFPGMDMISIGPTIKYPHSPEEQVHISTVEKFYEYVKKILEYK